MITVLGHRDVNDITGKLPQGTFLVVADMTTGWCGIDHYHIPWADETTENSFIGIGAADRPYFGVVALKKNLQIDFQLIFNFINIGCSSIIPLTRMPLCISMGKIRTRK